MLYFSLSPLVISEAFHIQNLHAKKGIHCFPALHMHFKYRVLCKGDTCKIWLDSGFHEVNLMLQPITPYRNDMA